MCQEKEDEEVQVFQLGVCTQMRFGSLLPDDKVGCALL